MSFHIKAAKAPIALAILNHRLANPILQMPYFLVSSLEPHIPQNFIDAVIDALHLGQRTAGAG
jgi:hypothetical protein